jgi:hypothetical protein
MPKPKPYNMSSGEMGFRVSPSKGRGLLSLTFDDGIAHEMSQLEVTHLIAQLAAGLDDYFAWAYKGRTVAEAK